MGAALIVNELPSALGLQCLRESYNLRYFPTNGEPPLPKITHMDVPTESSSVIFGFSVEENISREEIDLFPWLLEGDDEYNFFISRFKIKALRQISSQANPGRPFCLYLYLKSLSKYGSDLVSADGCVKVFVDSRLLILEQLSDPILISRSTFDFFMITVHGLSEFFLKAWMKPVGSLEREELCYANLLAPIRFIGAVSQFFLQPTSMAAKFKFVEIVHRFVVAFVYASHQLTDQQKRHLKCYLSIYI